jgi:hypothetical protein
VRRVREGPWLARLALGTHALSSSVSGNDWDNLPQRNHPTPVPITNWAQSHVLTVIREKHHNAAWVGLAQKVWAPRSSGNTPVYSGRAFSRPSCAPSPAVASHPSTRHWRRTRARVRMRRVGDAGKIFHARSESRKMRVKDRDARKAGKAASGKGDVGAGL